MIGRVLKGGFCLATGSSSLEMRLSQGNRNLAAAPLLVLAPSAGWEVELLLSLAAAAAVLAVVSCAALAAGSAAARVALSPIAATCCTGHRNWGLIFATPLI